jgi:hypothetical protein
MGGEDGLKHGHCTMNRITDFSSDRADAQLSEQAATLQL